MKGRFIFEHIWEARAAWEAMEYGLFLSVDFAKATQYIIIIALSSFNTWVSLYSLDHVDGHLPLHFWNWQQRGGTVQVRRESGVQQGDPLSPALLAMVCSVRVPILHEVCPHIKALLHGDHLMIYIPITPALIRPLIPEIMRTLMQYAQCVGLQVNPDKWAFLLRGFWLDHQKARLTATGISVKTKVKYLENRFGHITSEEAFAPHLAHALARTQFAAILPLTMSERFQLLQERI